ncbi:MAG TPA: glycosyltransferase [Acidimicrobiia bacterium]|nr:glycosyltransferase [Acidimicrobiia bacterium]
MAGLREPNAAFPDDRARTRAMTLSVVIPSRDVETVLPRQLSALAAQCVVDGDREVIVADNGSTDATRAVASASGIANVRVIDASGHAGRHHACNVGARAARSDAIVFLDADDEIAPGYLDAMASALREHAVVAARLDHSADPDWMRGVGSTVQTSGLQDEFGFLPHAAGATLGFQKPAFDEIGGFHERMTYCEDVDICWRAQLAGYDLAFAPDAVLRYSSRPDRAGMHVQHRNYGAAQALLYREFRAWGMPRRPAKAVGEDWMSVARGFVARDTGSERARWARRAGRNLGRLVGSLRYRVWYP